MVSHPMTVDRVQLSHLDHDLALRAPRFDVSDRSLVASKGKTRSTSSDSKLRSRIASLTTHERANSSCKVEICWTRDRDEFSAWFQDA